VFENVQAMLAGQFLVITVGVECLGHPLARLGVEWAFLFHLGFGIDVVKSSRSNLRPSMTTAE